MQVQKIRITLVLIWVRILRFFLVLKSASKSVTLGLPLNYLAFPLLPKMNMKPMFLGSKSTTCDSSLSSTVDVIISLYKFEKYKKVLEHSVRSCFKNPKITYHFVLVSGSDAEIDWLRSVIKNSHHQVHLVDERIGIYSAWNLAIKKGLSDFITNLNADDLRLPHSICSQAAALQNESASGSFGNFILTNDILSAIDSKNESWLASDLGAFDQKTLVVHSQNKMHCAPIWRRDLHARLGTFDDTLKSSGDTDFWLRAMEAGYNFIQYQPITAVYFHNPEGLSTSVASSGLKEWSRIRDAYIRRHYGD
jgi:glycosyltransferase involved in cell wall biosynthesis